MKSFFKIFFATLLSLLVFSIIIVIIGVWLIGGAMQPEKPVIGSKGVLVLDLSSSFPEQGKDNPISSLTGDESADVPGLYDVVRMIHYAKSDTAIKGIFIKAGYDMNGFATNEELRQALIDFKQSKKFITAYGEVINQKAYYVSTVADKIYCHPKGGVEFDGLSYNLYFLKGALDRLEIQPQIFYAGKFKSATEPLRATEMTDANRLQTNVLLGDLYATFLTAVSESREVDTATLHNYANTNAIRSTDDAVKYKLIDAAKYDDEWKAEISGQLGQKITDKINFVSFSKYAKAVDFKADGTDKIAIIYAQGDIVDGKGTDDEIGSDVFKNLIRKARMDNSIKAIVFRVNSPGGSSLASDVIWREVAMAKKDKPVVVSMGDYAASGGYYISCYGDSVFADPGTITGSIGVFSIIPNMQSFFKDKLGVTFDCVKTAPYADMGNISRPLTDVEKSFLQSDVDSIYHTFKTRVATGRKRDIVYIDSIAQGRVWTGSHAIQIGLVDRIGTLQDAVECAARMAKTKSYLTKEYPEPKGLLEQILGGSSKKEIQQNAIKAEIGTDEYKMLQRLKKVKAMFGVPQAKLPFDGEIN
jgi:protease-4